MFEQFYLYYPPAPVGLPSFSRRSAAENLSKFPLDICLEIDYNYSCRQRDDIVPR